MIVHQAFFASIVLFFAAPATKPNLLKSINLPAASVSGQWTQNTRGIVSGNDPVSLVKLAPAPRGEYDIKIQFSRHSGTGAIGVILAHRGIDFALLIGGSDHENASGFDIVNSHRWWDNASTTHAPLFKAGDKRTLTIKVRNDGVTALLTNKKICEMRTDYSTLALSPDMQIGAGSIGLATMQSSVIFSSVAIEPLRADDTSPPIKSTAIKTSTKTISSTDPLPVGSKWSGTRTEVNRANQSPCRMKVIERSGNSVTLEIVEHRWTRRWIMTVNGSNIDSTAFKELSGGAGVITGARASGTIEGPRLRLQYQWFVSDKRHKNAIVTGVIALDRDQ